MAHQPAVVGHRRLLFRVQNAEKIVRLRQRKFGVAKRGHGRERGGLFIAERAHRFIAVQQRAQMVEMHGHILRVCRIFHERKPLHDVALDGVRQIVYGVGAVGESEVDDRRGPRIGAVVAPE